MYSEAYSLSDSLFALLRDLIHERTGLLYDIRSRDIFASKLATRLVELGFTSFLDYYYLLKYDTTATAEWGTLMDTLTVRETYFWREVDQIKTLVDSVVPQHAARWPTTPLRIWSAACATGEEPLSIAIALHEANWFARLPITIVASDISPQAITKARRGVYTERSFRNLPAALREKYFTEVSGGWQIAPDLHNRISWTTANLLDSDAVAQLAPASVIFCRNVFIYFSEAAIRKTIRLFYERMPSPGYLFVGVSEPLIRLTSDFTLEEVGGAFVYTKHP